LALGVRINRTATPDELDPQSTSTNRQQGWTSMTGHDDEKKQVDVQRRQLVAGSLAIVSTASAGLLSGCGGGGSGPSAPAIELVSSQPANNATGVSNAASVALTFSSSVAVGAGAITITGPSGVVSTKMTTSGAVVTLVPASSLSPGGKYTVSVTTGITDAAGGSFAGSTFSFSTTPLALVSSTPTSGASGVGAAASIVLTFSETVTVGNGAITVTGPSGAAATTMVSNGATVTVYPLNALTSGQSYTVAVDSGVTDAAGNAFAGASIPFTVSTEAISLTAGALVSDSYNNYRWTPSPAPPWTVLSDLYNNGFRWLRMWVTTLSFPALRTTADWSTLPFQNSYWSCLEVSGAILSAAAAQGFSLHAVLFLSDQSASAGAQPLAAAWVGLTPAQLAVAVQQSATTTAAYYQSLGLNIDVFEIGNEIDFGICGIDLTTVPVPAGIDWTTDPSWMQANIWAPSATLLKAAITGVLSVYPNAKILLHIAGFGYSPGNLLTSAFFQSMVSLGVPFDIAGLSYPYLDAGNPVPQPYFAQADFLSALDAIAAVGKPVQIVEFDYPAASAGIPQTPSRSYPLTPAGQAQFVGDFAKAVNGRLERLWYWYPDYWPWTGQSGVTPDLSSSLYSAYATPRPAMAVFNQPPFATT
jgi:arabinogalactan endo-1,4-beta-galactosidase/methionine-rich copper-binding protein CopC